ncbi:MAG: tRNA (adenosine(37)-N6)-threonylcarbamoyltransferase complex ATPase subunit type 1 TsaE [bacterium]|nr:tRNA (adenosine(37)-N6)-threonylcarbamoyltransferase complex ATPase subunit type 1 TsaE [bacterium]
MIESSGPGETMALGESLGRRAAAGTVFAIRGGLGAGKTCLVQGIARGVGVAPSVAVASPSFVIITEYRGRLPFFHFDLYRIRDWREVFDVGWDDYLDRGGVIAVEWAERLGPLLPAGCTAVDIEITGEETRRITLAGGAGAGSAEGPS